MQQHWFQGSYRWIESVLLEMVRRGDARFERFLAAQLSELAAKPDDAGTSRDDRDFFLVTTLRRLQHAPDPLVLRVKSEAPIAAVWPQSPVFAVQILNADEHGARVHVANGGGYRSGRLERWRTDVRTLDGLAIEPFESRGGIGGGLFTWKELAPGESIDARIRLANYVAVPVPGTYEARLHYHDLESIANDRDLGNLILTTSEWTRFEVQPRTVRITKAEDARAKKIVAEAVVPESIVTYWMPYDPETPFPGEARTSEERLFEMGWKSVPALLAALEEEDLSVRRRAWVLAQLYNLTGLHDPSAQAGIVGKHEHAPGPLETGSTQDRAFLTGWSGDGPIEEPKQRAFADKWKQSATGFRFEIVD
jgi:hypothetical protein